MAIDFISLAQAAFFAALMTLGWSLMVNVPRHYIWQSLLISAIGYSLRELLIQFGVNLVLTSFVAAVVTAFLSIYLAKRYLITPKTILVPALLCMMPGVTAYKAMISLVQLGYFGYDQTLFVQMLNYAFHAMFITGALVLGLSLPAAIFYRKQPIV